MQLVDSHCHLDLLEPTQQQEEVIARAQEAGICHFLNVSVSIADFPQVLKTASTYPFVSASVGLHPNEQAEEVNLNQLLAWGGNAKVVAIGETGLDYFRSNGDLSWQQERFRCHIQAAKILAKPLIIHMRDATADTLHILKTEDAAQVGGVMHCFTENWEVAKKALDMNFYISFAGNLTYKNAKLIQETARYVPLDRILIETDSPYLAPVPQRGHANEPAFLLHTAAYLAELQACSLEVLAEQSTENFFRLFQGAKKNHV